MGVAKVIVPSRALEVLEFNAALWRTESQFDRRFCQCFDSDFDTCHRLTAAGLVNTSGPSGFMPLPLTGLPDPRPRHSSKCHSALSNQPIDPSDELRKRKLLIKKMEWQFVHPG